MYKIINTSKALPFVFLCLTFLFVPLDAFSQNAKRAQEEAKSENYLETETKGHTSKGFGYSLVTSGTILISLGMALEAVTAIKFLTSSDEERSIYSNSYGLFTAGHIVSSILITTGVTTIMTGSMYFDDSTYGKNRQKKAQIITGAIFGFFGIAGATTGSILYDENQSDRANINDISIILIGGGASLAINGLANLIIGIVL